MSVHRRIAIPSLAGGVGRQASNKRLPTEAENLDNCLVTLEKSVEKRPPLEFIPGSSLFYGEESLPTDDEPAPGSLIFNELSDGSRYKPTTEDDIFFKWLSIDSDNKFLIGINFSLTIDDNVGFDLDTKKKFMTVWRLNATDKRMDLQTFDYTTITRDHFTYLTQNPDGKAAFETYDFALFGSALILLNKQVSARFRDDIARDINNSPIVNFNLSFADTADYRLESQFEDFQLTKLVLKEATSGNFSDKTFRGVNTKLQFGIVPHITQVDLSVASSGNAVCSFYITKSKRGNDRFEIDVRDVDMISGTLPSFNSPSANNLYKFAITEYVPDFKGKKLNYRVSTLPDSVGKNLVPISEDTVIDNLRVRTSPDTDPINPLSTLFSFDKPARIVQINNPVDNAKPGNVKDPNAAAQNDDYFADQFYINRGSVQYTVQLIDYDTNKEPGSLELAPNIEDANGAPQTDQDITITIGDLRATHKLLPTTELDGSVTIDANGIVTAKNIIRATQSKTKTLGDLAEIINASGADAKLVIDNVTNQLSVVDANTEDLVLTVSSENFTTNRTGNQNFIESMGLTQTDARALQTLTRDTKLSDLKDNEGFALLGDDVVSRVNNLAIIRQQDVDLNDGSVRSNVILHTINLSSINPNSTIKDLANEIETQTDKAFGLFYSNNNKRVLRAEGLADSSDDQTVGIKIMELEVDSVDQDGNTTFKDDGTSSPFVMDIADDAPLESDGKTVKRGKFGELMGLRNTLADFTLVVEDKNFNLSQQTDLGQSVVSFQNIKIPTEENDTIKTNAAADTLFSLYEGGTLSTSATKQQRGRGKVYEVRERFFDFIPGFYRAISEPDGGNPYYEVVRSEDRYSVVDERTWPIVLDYNTTSGTWSMVTPSWSPRQSGNISNNPGPSPFVNATDIFKRDPRRITSITTWRNRLWFAVDDTVFSSEFSNFFNLFLSDPSTIVDTDVIDVRSSLDKVSKINNMISFYDFLFVNTDNDIQFELQGSENQITPFTAELSPTTFYASDPLAKPQLIGSQIYFFAPQKIYLYYSSANKNVITQAVETTQHCEGYLPKNFGTIARAPSQDSIIMVDADNTNELYLYTQRFSGDNVAQNSVFRYILDENVTVDSMEVFDNYLYMVTSRPFQKKNNTTKDYYFVERTYLESIENDLPRLDHLHFFEPNIKFPEDSDTQFNVVYDSDTTSSTFDTTTFILPYQDENVNTIVFGPGYGDYSGRSIPCVNVTEAGKKTRLRVDGRFDDFLAVKEDQGLIESTVLESEAQGFISQAPETTDDQGFLFGVATGGQIGIYVGTPYTMNIEMSPQFVRQEQGEIIDGVLNLRTISTRYFNTGEYAIKVQRKGEEDFVSISTKRDPFYKESLYNESTIDRPVPVSSEGEFISKIFGDSERMRVFIQSDHYTPCNITHIEFKGVFKQSYRSGQN